MDKKLLELNHVSKSYPMGEHKVVALKDINLAIKRGEFISIVGPSGSGKSTLMHIIGLLDNPTEGQVILAGKDVSSLDQETLAHIRNKSMGFVFQQFNLLERVSALENVALPLFYVGIGEVEMYEMARSALMHVGLGNRANHHPNQLSGGEQQRLAIARALVNDPDILLADEPTGNLDSKSGGEIIAILSRLNKEGRTIILVTHEMYFARYAKRVIHLRDGRIINVN